ncbi:MAG: methyltransferase domain-containing protein [Oscillochloris sp.]|nr:methyltransferase domain-containing protein [Oscillochloris sp.]
MSETPPIDIRFEIRLNQDGVDWTRRSYDQIYQGDGIRQLDSFYRWLLRVLDPTPGSRLLDVATGEGVLPNFARSLYSIDAIGCDLSSEAAKIARSEGAATFCVSSGEDLPFPAAEFDYVTCIGSLEHFLDMRAGAREMARVLKPGGTALILLPNTYSILGNVYAALKRGMSTIDPQPLQRYAARAEWALLLEESGLHVARTVKYEREWPDNLDDARWYMRHWRTAVHLLLTPVIPLNWASCFVYLCRRSDGDQA